jgi:hypothetical protein
MDRLAQLVLKDIKALLVQKDLKELRVLLVLKAFKAHLEVQLARKDRLV